jgi:cephalosporin hydroxylase
MLEKHLKPPSERKYSGPYIDQDIAVLMNYGRVSGNYYDGRQIMHEPMFLNALRTIIEYERPSYILEFGTLQGGLAAFMSDAAKNCGHSMKVISFDIDVNDRNTQRPIDAVEIVQLDVLDISHYLTTNHEMITSLVGKKLVIDDIGINTVDLLKSFESHLNTGDHFICCHTLNQENHDALLDYSNESYWVNALACDMFGENFIENPNGFLVKK